MSVERANKRLHKLLTTFGSMVSKRKISYNFVNVYVNKMYLVKRINIFQALSNNLLLNTLRPVSTNNSLTASF